MKPKNLSLSLEESRSRSLICPENWYLEEFHRASADILQGAALWGPGFGKAGGKKAGSLDCYLKLRTWGFDFTRDGENLESYYIQLQPPSYDYKTWFFHTLYELWLRNQDLYAWLLVDFRQTIPTVAHPCKQARFPNSMYSEGKLSHLSN